MKNKTFYIIGNFFLTRICIQATVNFYLFMRTYNYVKKKKIF